MHGPLYFTELIHRLVVRRTKTPKATSDNCGSSQRPATAATVEVNLGLCDSCLCHTHTTRKHKYYKYIYEDIFLLAQGSVAKI